MDEKLLIELIEKNAIQERIYLYCELVDSHNFDPIVELFTEDAFIDYTSCGSIKGSPKELVAALKRDFRHFCASQHIVTNLVISLNGDRAYSKYYLFNPMSWRGKDKLQSTMLFGSHYEGEWIKQDGVWKISRFIQIKNYRLTPIINEKF